MEDNIVVSKTVLDVGESLPLLRSNSIVSNGDKIKDIVVVHVHDSKGIVEWSWKESVCCDCEGENKFYYSVMVCSLSPCLLASFSVTLLGKVVHDVYNQGLPLNTNETPWERKVRVQGVLTTTGLMICIIFIAIIILIHRYFQFKIEGTFDDMETVYLRTLVTIATSINVIFSNVVFLNAMKNKWQQTINYFIIGSYAIALSQIAMGTFDTWILLTGEYTFSDVAFCIVHLSETLYSAMQCVLYLSMWNYYQSSDSSAVKSVGGGSQDSIADDGQVFATANIVMLTLVNWASILISFRFTSISDYLQRRSTVT